ncbi:MAG: hypothetical protein AB8E15_06725 [Bdellovibrionales bacterium]
MQSTDYIDILLSLQKLSAFGMLVVIWFVQILHYPSFRFIAREKFESFESMHQHRISYIVIPLMLTELILASYFLIFTSHWLSLLNLFLVLFLWIYTFLVSAKIHGKLNDSHSIDLIEKLISTNWLRTSVWTIKFLLLLLW